MKRAWWRRDTSPEDQILQEIGWLRLIGGVLFIIGAFVIAFTMIQDLGLYVEGFELIVAGLIFRAAGGIWATLERIARK